MCQSRKIHKLIGLPRVYKATRQWYEQLMMFSHKRWCFLAKVLCRSKCRLLLENICLVFPPKSGPRARRTTRNLIGIDQCCVVTELQFKHAQWPWNIITVLDYRRQGENHHFKNAEHKTTEEIFHMKSQPDRAFECVQSAGVSTVNFSIILIIPVES